MVNYLKENIYVNVTYYYLRRSWTIPVYVCGATWTFSPQNWICLRSLHMLFFSDSGNAALDVSC